MYSYGINQGLLCSSSLWINRMLANITVYCLASHNNEKKTTVTCDNKNKNKTSFSFEQPQPNLI